VAHSEVTSFRTAELSTQANVLRRCFRAFLKSNSLQNGIVGHFSTLHAASWQLSQNACDFVGTSPGRRRYLSEMLVTYTGSAN
jgi:hypothetical protein